MLPFAPILAELPQLLRLPSRHQVHHSSSFFRLSPLCLVPSIQSSTPSPHHHLESLYPRHSSTPYGHSPFRGRFGHQAISRSALVHRHAFLPCFLHPVFLPSTLAPAFCPDGCHSQAKHTRWISPFRSIVFSLPVGISYFPQVISTSSRASVNFCCRQRYRSTPVPIHLCEARIFSCPAAFARQPISAQATYRCVSIFSKD